MRVFFIFIGLILSNAAQAVTDEDIQELTCLALNIYHEARGEPLPGMFAVGQVVMNRVESDRFPDTVCGVVWQKKWSSKRKRYVAQFSWTLDSNPTTPYEMEAWKLSWRVAEVVYSVPINMVTDSASHYHADYVKPDWAGKLTRVAQIGRHVFYY